MLGFVPLVPAVLIALIMPESVRWLVTRGRHAEARAIVARTLNVAPESLPQPVAACASGATPPGGFADLLAEPRLFWLTVVVWFGASTANYGVFLWGPTIVALLYGVPPTDMVAFTGAALLLIIAALAASWIPARRAAAVDPVVALRAE